MKKLIAIYRTAFLLPSEAFIPSQLSGFQRYYPVVWYRDTTQDVNATYDVQTVCLSKSSRLWRRFLFTLFGLATVDDLPLLVHAHFGPDAAIILPFAKRNKIPLIVTFHGFDAQQSRWALFKSGKLSNILFLLREKALFRYASKIIAVSGFLKERLILRGYPEDKVIVHYIGVDTEKFNSTNGPKIPNRLINVSRHVKWKGIDTILRALPGLISKYPDLYLVQIGAGTETAELQRLAADLGVAKHVEWCGALPHNKVLSELNKSSVYVHASQQDVKGQTEAFGIALIEAQACGLPVVASRSGGIPEAMVEGETGLLFEEGDFSVLAVQVDKLLSDADYLATTSMNAREFVKENFDVKNCSGKLESIYDEALKS